MANIPAYLVHGGRHTSLKREPLRVQGQETGIVQTESLIHEQDIVDSRAVMHVSGSLYSGGNGPATGFWSVQDLGGKSARQLNGWGEKLRRLVGRGSVRQPDLRLSLRHDADQSLALRVDNPRQGYDSGGHWISTTGLTAPLGRVESVTSTVNGNATASVAGVNELLANMRNIESVKFTTQRFDGEIYQHFTPVPQGRSATDRGLVTFTVTPRGTLEMRSN